MTRYSIGHDSSRRAKRRQWIADAEALRAAFYGHGATAEDAARVLRARSAARRARRRAWGRAS